VFLTASVTARAERRYKQLIEKGFSAKLDDLSRDLQARDDRDSQRTVAPLKPASDARTLDTSNLDVDETVQTVVGWFRELQQTK
jgi:cytidylate kinase